MTQRMTVMAARQSESIGSQVKLQGWIRTRRDSKGGFSFLELNDGSCQANIQVVADNTLENYEREIKKLSAGCSVTVLGEVKPSGGKGQATEVLASSVEVHGWAGPRVLSIAKRNATRLKSCASGLI